MSETTHHTPTAPNGELGPTAGPASADVVELTARLVAAVSENPPGDERSVADAVDAICADLGLPIPRRLAKVATRPNQVVDIEFGAGGRHLALSGHLDTKPVGAGDWNTDPFTLTAIDGRLVGRGVADMKGALAAMLIATARASNRLDSGGVSLVFTADEEFGAGFGSKFLSETTDTVGRSAWDAVVIGEPGGINADWDRLHVGSRGIANVMFNIATSQGHSGVRDECNLLSATEVASRLLLELNDDFRPSFASIDGLEVVPQVTAGVRIEGGIGYGVIPGSATMAMECRLAPGMDEQVFMNELTTFVEARRDERATITVALENWLPAVTSSPTAEIARLASEAVEAATGNAPPTAYFPATTDATFLRTITDVPILPAFGPGLLSDAHTANESIDGQALRQAVDIYEHLIVSFCGATS